MGILRAKSVIAGYGAHDEILRGIDFDLEPGEIVAVVGPNGAGKSTLLKAFAGIVRARSGDLRYDERDVSGLAPRELAALGVAYVPQERNVFPTMTVDENLEMGGYLAPGERRARAAGVFERFPVLAERRRHAARTLSGGQRQILAMAMALMVEPRVLLLDEPSAGLAPLAAETLFSTIVQINAEGVAIVLVEQNALDAMAIARRAYLLVDGRTARTGDARELAADPDVRRAFLGA
ncbi:MAG: ABC transporter ATP-binding protein [Candidatus Eremiobacteraeota bacterium]|nr:ABC transporter ATP-binding protein [Candidatus Eremiobacteraeota bacterium]